MTFAKKLWHNWPDYFTVGVVCYLFLLAMDLGDHVPNDLRRSSSAQSSSELTTTAQPTTTTTVPFANGALTFKVMAFRVVPDRDNPGRINGKFTVEITNNTDANVKFAPGAFVLKHQNGGTVEPQAIPAPAIDVSPHLSQLTPISFPLPANPNGNYTLLYQGQEIFSGSPT